MRAALGLVLLLLLLLLLLLAGCGEEPRAWVNVCVTTVDSLGETRPLRVSLGNRGPDERGGEWIIPDRPDGQDVSLPASFSISWKEEQQESKELRVHAQAVDGGDCYEKVVSWDHAECDQTDRWIPVNMERDCDTGRSPVFQGCSVGPLPCEDQNQ